MVIFWISTGMDRVWHFFHINSIKINNDNPRITHLRENIGVTIYDKIPVNVTRVTHVNRVHSLPRGMPVLADFKFTNSFSERGLPNRERNTQTTTISWSSESWPRRFLNKLENQWRYRRAPRQQHHWDLFELPARLKQSAICVSHVRQTLKRHHSRWDEA